MWGKIEGLYNGDCLTAPIEVKIEIEKVDDFLLEWIRDKKEIFI